MDKLTEHDAEQYITSHMVNFLAQSRPFGGVKSPNGMRKFFSSNVTEQQRFLIVNTSKDWANSAIAFIEQNVAEYHKEKDVHWFVTFNWGYRLCITNNVNRSQYTDLLLLNDPITLAVVAKAKADEVFFDLSNLVVVPSNQVYSLHK